MKEYLIKIPDDAEEVMTAIMEKFGIESVAVEKKYYFKTSQRNY